LLKANKEPATFTGVNQFVTRKFPPYQLCKVRGNQLSLQEMDADLDFIQLLFLTGHSVFFKGTGLMHLQRFRQQLRIS